LILLPLASDAALAQGSCAVSPGTHNSLDHITSLHRNCARQCEARLGASYAGKLVTVLGKGGGVSVTVRADHASIEG